MKEIKKSQWMLLIILAVLSLIISLYFTIYIDSMLSRKEEVSYNLLFIVIEVISSGKMRILFLCFFTAFMLGCFYLVFGNTKDYKSDQIKVTPQISIPVSAGQGQCGTAKWLDKKQYDLVFGHQELDLDSQICHLLFNYNLKDIAEELQLLMEQEGIKQSIFSIQSNNPEEILEEDRKETSFEIFTQGGVVLGKIDVNKKREILYFISEDVHTLIIGATRCGKTRTIVLQTILCLAMAGESIIAIDPKSELYDYTCQILKLLGHTIITLDFKNPRKSSRYNFLQQIIDYVAEEDVPSAIDATWDLVSQLVGEAKGEKLWTDGEASVIAACIMAVVYDNRKEENRKYQNLTNVYYFISQMCTPIQVGNTMVVPLNSYVKDIPIHHPARGLLSVGEIAPSRTRGSFYTSALMTLKLFTNPLIADMTSTTDYNPMEVGEKKTAIFIILPDEKKTYHSLASLYVTQQYQLLSKASDYRGGRLKRRTNFVCDEFGNFVKIPIFPNMLTVGGGKGIRFNIFLQNFSQLEEIYEKEASRTIKSNCENWIYLQTDDTETLKEISEKLGKYTITTYSLSASHSRYTNPNSSQNVSLTGRELLMSNEVKRIERPYSLVTSRKDPAIFYAPDLTKWNFNKIMGLGDKEHNRLVRLARERHRVERFVENEMELWGIWDVYIEQINEEVQRQEEERKLLAKLAASMSKGE